jgi:hypothetical protein
MDRIKKVIFGAMTAGLIVAGILFGGNGSRVAHADPNPTPTPTPTPVCTSHCDDFPPPVGG